MKKYTIDYGMGQAILYTPYPWEARFNTLANTCFGIRKNIMCVCLIDTEDVPCNDFERLEFAGDVYVWREDGARKMLEPYPYDDWDMTLCEECQYQGKEFTEKGKEFTEKAEDIKETYEELEDDGEGLYKSDYEKYTAVLRENSELKKLCQDRCEEIEFLKKKNDDFGFEMDIVLNQNGNLKKENEELRAQVERLEMKVSDSVYSEAEELKKRYDELDIIHHQLIRKLQECEKNMRKYENVINIIEAVLGREIPYDR